MKKIGSAANFTLLCVMYTITRIIYFPAFWCDIPAFGLWARNQDRVSADIHLSVCISLLVISLVLLPFIIVLTLLVSAVIYYKSGAWYKNRIGAKGNG